MSEKSATERFVEATALINEVINDLAADLVTLSPEARKSAVRPPANAVDILRRMADALRRLPQLAAFLGQDLDAQEACFQQVLAVESAIRATEFLLQGLQDTRTSLLTGRWEAGLVAYGTCQTLSRRDPAYGEVVRSMAPAFKRTRKADDDTSEKDKKDDKESTKAKEKDKAKSKEGEKAKDEEGAADKEPSSDAAK